MIKPPSKKINSAENAIKKSIEHFFLLNFNYPSEAGDCIVQLNTAVELLLQEMQSQYSEQTVEEKSLYKLIRDYGDWDTKQKDIIHWLRVTRNDLQHEGELDWKERTWTRNRLLEVYRIAGQIYESLGYEIEEVFVNGEQNILRGDEPNWKEEAKILADKSLQYYREENRDIGISIANAALEKAVRGFAKNWRIIGANELPIPDLVEALDNNEYLFVSDLPIHYDDWFSRPLFFTRDTHDECHLGKDCMSSLDNILQGQASYAPDRFDEEFKNALEDSRDVVVSLVKSAPYLDYFENIVNNWSKIIDSFTLHIPGAIIPELNNEYGISSSWYDGAEIWITFEGSPERWDWTENHEAFILEIIENTCGKKPDDLQVSINWSDSKTYSR